MQYVTLTLLGTAKSFSKPHDPLSSTDLRFHSPQTDTGLHCETMDRLHSLRELDASRGVPVYSPAFADTHLAFPAWMARLMLTWVVD